MQLSAASTDLLGTGGDAVAELLNPMGGLTGGGSVPGLADLPTLGGLLANLDPAATPGVLAPYSELVTNTLANLELILAAWQADPFPFLHQFIDNQLGYLNTIVTGLESVGGALGTGLSELPGQLGTVFGDLASGNLTGAASGINTILGSLLMLPSAELFESGILDIPGEIAQNATNVISALTDTSITLTLPAIDTTPPFIHGSADLLLGLPIAFLVNAIGAPYEAVVAAGGSVGAITGDLESGDFLGALGALVDAPAVIANGFLNGETPLSIPEVSIPPITLTIPGIPPFIPPGSATITPSVGGTIPLGGLLVQPMHPSLVLDAPCVGSGAVGIAACVPINLLSPIHLTAGGTPIGGLVPFLVNFLPQQLAAAIADPQTATSAVTGQLESLLGGAGLDGLLNPGSLAAMLDPSDLTGITSQLSADLLPALTGLFDPAAVTGLFDPAAITGMASQLGVDLVSVLAGLF